MELAEEKIFQLISFSGTGRSFVFEAFQKCQEGNYEEADKCMEDAKEQLLLAHKVQTSLIQEEAKGNKYEVNILLVHAQDHLMTSILAKELIEKMIKMQKEINELKN